MKIAILRLYHGYKGRNTTGVKGDIMNPITMKMIQPLAFKGYEGEDLEEADVSTSASEGDTKLERQPEKDEVVKEKEAEKAPEKVSLEKQAATTKPEKPEETIEQKMQSLNKNADAVAKGVNDVANSAAKTIVGVTGGAAVIGGAAGPAMDNMKKAANAFKPMTDGIKNIAQKFQKNGAKAASQAGDEAKAALVATSGINLKSIITRVRSIF